MPTGKKRRLTNGAGDGLADDLDGSVIKRLLLDDIDLEISLRQRLALMIESRIALALLLQDSLTKDISVDGLDKPTNFRNVALEALAAIETPCDVLFSRELDFSPFFRSKPPEHHPPPTTMPTPVVQPRSRIHSYKDSATVRNNVKLLFIRDTLASPPTLFKMLCPDCSRGDFTNLQGLLNHCRLSHKKDYGNHDECMQKCAVVVPEEEVDWVINNGTELGGVNLPSLRRLFQIAVGDELGNALKGNHEIENHITDESPNETLSVNHLTRTLGHHKDSPALALFLGRAAKRRRINVSEDAVSVDVANSEGEPSGLLRRPAWRMPFAHRNTAKPDLDDIPDLVASYRLDPSSVPSVAQYKEDAAGAARSRFHIIARVVVSDRSLWLPHDRRPHNPAHTHRWMLSVESPSYSLHITTILTKLTMTCVTNPPPSGLLEPLTITEPPFAIVSTSDKPFLARLVLEWTGKQNPPIEIEHWVELDPMKVSGPVLGDEQVIDVELDRNTELLPVREGHCPPTWDKDHLRDSQPPNAVPPKEADRFVPGHIRTLRSLLPRVPMTMKDVKGHPPAQHPYKLVASPAHLRKLVAGRRKAIEWGRARALRMAYDETIHLPQQSEEIVSLSTADVFRWMADECLLHRVANRKPGNKDSQSTKMAKVTREAHSHPGTFCSHCGLEYDYHTFLTKPESGLAERFSFCDAVPMQFPILDLNHTFLNLSPNFSRRASLHCIFQGRVPWKKTWRSPLLAISDPALTLAIRDVIIQLKLNTFINDRDLLSTPGQRLFPLVALGGNMTEIENHMAPFALLSIVTKAFIGTLVRGGLEVADQDDFGKDQGRKMKKRLLTPSHILRSLSKRTQSQLHESVLTCLARPGIPA